MSRAFHHPGLELGGRSGHQTRSVDSERDRAGLDGGLIGV